MGDIHRKLCNDRILRLRSYSPYNASVGIRYVRGHDNRQPFRKPGTFARQWQSADEQGRNEINDSGTDQPDAENDCILFLKGERPIYDKKNWPFNTEVFKEAEKIAGQNGYKNPVYVSYDERNKKYITTRFESRLNYISKEEFTFFEEKAKEDSSIQTFQIDEEAFLYLNFNETPQPSLRELEKMVKEIQVAEVNEEEEEKETDQQPDMLQDRGQWDLSGDIIDCFRRYSSELSPEEQEEIIKGIEEGMTD